MTEEREVVLVQFGDSAKRSGPVGSICTQESFRIRRAFAEERGARWFVLSAHHGLLDPDEWVTPRTEEDPLPSVRHWRAWADWVAAQLDQRLQGDGGLGGVRLIVLADPEWEDQLGPAVEAWGAALNGPTRRASEEERDAWVLERLDDPPPALPAHTETDARSGVMAGQEAVVGALLEYRREALQRDRSRLGFAADPEADALLLEPFAFLLGVVFDEGIKAERAWAAPYELKRGLGHLDPRRMRNQLDDVRRVVIGPPALHRYTSLMPEALVGAAARVCEEYGGDAGRIWLDEPTAAELDRRFRQFKRIGPKKAAMAVELLMTHFNVPIGLPEGTNIAYDVHVRRVFLRTGLVNYDSFDEVTSAARRLHPDHPSMLDLPTWLVGRQHCHAGTPDCAGCPLQAVCPKRTHLQISSN